jgi:hypothetical protein
MVQRIMSINLRSYTNQYVEVTLTSGYIGFGLVIFEHEKSYLRKARIEKRADTSMCLDIYLNELKKTEEQSENKTDLYPISNVIDNYELSGEEVASIRNISRFITWHNGDKK